MSRAVQVGFFAAILALSVGTSSAQQAQFEAATIKASHPQPGTGALTMNGRPGGQLRMMNVPLRQWVERGLLVPDYALKAPAWLDTALFDLDARLPATPLDQKSAAEMMKALLVKRFGLKWHEEQATVSGFELMQDKKVLLQSAGLLDRLRPGSASGPTMISGNAMSTSDLAAALGKVLGKPVVDATHLSGVYNIKLMWRPADDAAAAQQKQYGIDVDNLPLTVSVTLQEKLGLRLQSAKVPSKVIVVDNLNRQPSEN